MAVAAAGSAPGSALTPAQWAASPLAEYISFVCGGSSARNSRAASRVCLRDSYFASPLLRWDSWAHTGSYDRAAAGAVLEYSPLLNARAHPMALIRDAKNKLNALQSTPKTGSAAAAAAGSDAPAVAAYQPIQIQNVEFRAQYASFLSYLCARYSGLARAHHWAKLLLCYYFILQERTDDAKRLFATISREALRKEMGHADQLAHAGEAPPSAGSSSSSSNSIPASGVDAPAAAAPDLLIQFDYMDAYLDFFDNCVSPSAASASAAAAGSGSAAPVPAAGVSVGHRALSIAKRYQRHPVRKVRGLFDEVEQQLHESAANARPEDLDYDQRLGLPAAQRDREMDALAATEPALDLTLQGRCVEVAFRGVDEFSVDFFVMNLELLFSSAPFLAADASGSGGGKSAVAKAAMATAGGDGGGSDAPFLFLHPNHSVRVCVDEPVRTLDEAAESKEDAEAEDEKSHSEFKVSAPSAAALIRSARAQSRTRTVAIPDSLSSSNLYVQLSSARFPHLGGHAAVFQHQMAVALAANYGRLTVRAKTDAVATASASSAGEAATGSAGPSTLARSAAIRAGDPLAGVYVKVYARLLDGEVSFYRDGHTDLRGCFDYSSLSTDKLTRVQRFAILLISKQHGAVVVQAKPPAQR